MAGGTFNSAGKVRPGTYINFESSRRQPVDVKERGVVLLPLIKHPYGPEKEFVTIEAAAPDANYTKLGYSVFDPELLLVREALKNAHTVVVYIPKQGSKAAITEDGVTATARYGGTRGNALSFSAVADPTGGFDVSVFLEGTRVSAYKGIKTAADIVALADPWVEFTCDTSITAVAGAKLTGGSNGVATNEDIMAFLEDTENVKWNAMAFTMDPSGQESDTVPALQQAVKTKIISLREGSGKYRTAVVAGFAADHEGVINVTNGVVLEDGTKLTAGQATAWVAGADAGASYVHTNTHRVYDGAVAVNGIKNNEQAEAAINAGEFFFTATEAGTVVAEYDINSLVKFDLPKDATYRKNRVRRVLDTLGEAIMAEFIPGKYTNNETGWDIMDGMGGTILKRFENDGAIRNVDYTTDFKVDRNASKDDHAMFDVMVQPQDSADKLYFTIKTR